MKRIVFILTPILAFLSGWVGNAAEKTDPADTTLAVRNGYIRVPIYVYDHWRWFLLDTTRDVTAFHQTFTNHLKSAHTASDGLYFGPQFFMGGQRPGPGFVLV